MKKVFMYALSAIVALSSCKKSNENKTEHYTVNTPNSGVNWKGYLLSGHYNEGTFEVTSDDIKVKDGKVSGGSFTIPIMSLNVVNLTGELKQQLEGHLKSEDFFNILVHPNAKYVITGIEPYTQAPSTGVVSGANYLVTGNFTLLGVTKPLTFPARITFANNTVNVEALFKLNRVNWGMTYASDPELGEHHILPEVDIHLTLAASKR